MTKCNPALLDLMYTWLTIGEYVLPVRDGIDGDVEWYP
jgi:hypothetical protein